MQETRRVKGPLKNKYKFNQDFFFPITNKFDQIYIQIVSYVTTGLFQGQHKESIIKEYCIPLPFLKVEPFCNNIIRYRISMDDLKKAKVLDHLSNSNLMQLFGMAEGRAAEISSLP